MYYTDEFDGEIQYDCLQYTVMDDITIYPVTPLSQHQSIMYCFRLIEFNKTNRENNIIGNVSFNERVFSINTFEELKSKHVNVMDLIEWSAPIDLAERYADYLMHDGDSEQIFLNCTIPWFGTTCQYTFQTDDSFSEIVKMTFKNRNKHDGHLQYPNTCYVHLSCQYRSWGPICLDWREICDGKIDCMNNGVDEQHCFQLEENECEENEYRCQNGLCIPKEFVRDDPYNPECLDRTDDDTPAMYPRYCSMDPSFRCEENTCKNIGKGKQGFSCGDGECMLGSTQCTNARGSWLHKVRRYFIDQDFCRMAVSCLTKFLIGDINDEHKEWCRNLNRSTGHAFVHMFCPSIFDFLGDFLIHGHVRMLYTKSDIISTNLPSILPYICYKKELCRFLTSTINITMANDETITCRHFHELNITEYYWANIATTLLKLFHPCSRLDTGMSDIKNLTLLFHCPNSTKYISKHRLLDSIRDCQGNEDETYPATCALNDKYRLKCRSNEQCIAPALINDGSFDCPDYTDEAKKANLEYKTRISFQTLCDRFVELTSLLIDGNEVTDETDCEHWPCNNTYTRCDTYWNCLDGADEVNCPLFPVCPTLEHICISPVTNNITCLSINRTNDGKIDCLGGTDERYICEKIYPKYGTGRFLCNSNHSQCAETSRLCDKIRDCAKGEDEQFCSCTDNGGHNMAQEFLRQLATSYKPKTVYFALEKFPNYSSSLLIGPSSRNMTYKAHSIVQRTMHMSSAPWPSTRRCNRGLNVRLQNEYKCLCPPSYYGHFCEYQNERVSLTLRIRTEAEWRTVFVFLITLMDNNGDRNSYDQFTYTAIRDCDKKFNMYLLYKTRPKNLSKNYSIRIDAFDRHLLTHRASWLYPVRFYFLPVHRTAIFLIIPWEERSKKCHLNCNHGHCIFMVNNPDYLACQCNHGWSGKRCNIKEKCNCSSQSLCLGLINNRSICLCPLGKFGPRCLLSDDICQSEPCSNGGVCIPNDYGRKSKLQYYCTCKDGYSGNKCEHHNTRIEMKFESSIKIPSSILAHLITINDNAHPTRTTLFQKIEFNQNSAVIFTDIRFRLLFAQFDEQYYLAFHSSVQSHFQSISTMIIRSHRCLSISELFNSTIVNLHVLRRLKYYHLPCQKHPNLVCFYDFLYLCLCTHDRQANCFEFDHNITYNCQGRKYCANGARCFEDHPLCPKSSKCVCKDCFYGSRCEYSTRGFDLSLDIILVYHIQSNLSFLKQPDIVKISVAFSTIMFLIGFINGVFSILTFRTSNSLKVGCGMYLLTTSIVSILLTSIFSFKIIFFIVSQMRSITRRSFFSTNCVLTDFVLRILLTTSDWLNACVSIERVVAIVKGPYFNLKTSKIISRYIILTVILITILSSIHDPLHRELVDDFENDKRWCILNYSKSVLLINSIVLVLHFSIPFLLNMISSIMIIILLSRQRASVQRKNTRIDHFRVQFREHKHLLISPCLLTLLALPRLTFSFLSGCMSSSRDSWFFLIGYFISFFPTMSTFFVFILPSKTYKKEFLSILKGK